jgi:mono/diheme cytochrome c family protein
MFSHAGIISRLFLAFLIAFAAPAPATADGGATYAIHCAPCHGESGAGDGPDTALLHRRPTSLRGEALEPYSVEQLTAKILDGRELPLGLDQEALRARAEDVEGLIRHLQRIPSIDWRLVEPGEEIYFSRCSSCHGPLGRPPAELPAGVRVLGDLSDPGFQDTITDAELLQAVRHGKDGMPALIPRVPESDGPALVAYVRLMSPGFVDYQTHCASCHGADGRAAGTLGEEMRLPTVVFDAAYFRRVDPEALRTQAWHMAAEKQVTMPHYRRVLSESQTRAVAAYMKRAFQ